MRKIFVCSVLILSVFFLHHNVAFGDQTSGQNITPTVVEDNDCLMPGQPDLDNSQDDVICVSTTPAPTDIPQQSQGGGQSDGKSDGRNDGLGCGSHDCSVHTPLAPDTGRGVDR